MQTSTETNDAGEVPAIAQLAALERQIATEAAWTDLECIARMVRPASATSGPQYDLTLLREDLPGDDPEVRASEAAHLATAVRYLDLRGLLVRPIPGQPHIVSISPALLATVEGGAA